MPSKKVILRYWNWEAVDAYVDYKGELQRVTRLDELEKIYPLVVMTGLWNKYNDKNFDANSLYEIELCFACGLFLQTQRAHILSVAEGGTDSVDNIHLLCKNCHGESEMISGEKYRNWFERKSADLAFNYWWKEREPILHAIVSQMKKIKPLKKWTAAELTHFVKQRFHEL